MKAKERIEFGDFQTPLPLARAVCALVERSGFRPLSAVEPTCGSGSFIAAALDAFSSLRRVLGFDVNPAHCAEARRAAARCARGRTVEIREADFFLTDWTEILRDLPDPILILGNPPWVTNSGLAVLESRNVPTKSNPDGLRGIDALTGKSNFDISEWMLRRSLEWLDGRDGMLAVLCKTGVARKVLFFGWSSGIRMAAASIHRIDALQHFRASVDACVLLVRALPGGTSDSCDDFATIEAERPSASFGLRDGRLVSDVSAYDRWRRLAGQGLAGWRSGVKHDCGRILELRREGGGFRNGLDEVVDVESELVFPLLKSSDIARDRVSQPRRWLLVTQRSIGEDTRLRLHSAPKAWRYLMSHADALDRRASSIYRNRPRFSIFGVGPYSFAPWKVAVSGLYKDLHFVKVPAIDGRPVLLDDTCYFFPCESEEECDALLKLVDSTPAQEFLSSLVFRDSKRPITAGILNALDLGALARIMARPPAGRYNAPAP